MAAASAAGRFFGVAAGRPPGLRPAGRLVGRSAARPAAVRPPSRRPARLESRSAPVPMSTAANVGHHGGPVGPLDRTWRKSSKCWSAPSVAEMHAGAETVARPSSPASVAKSLGALCPSMPSRPCSSRAGSSLRRKWCAMRPKSMRPICVPCVQCVQMRRRQPGRQPRGRPPGHPGWPPGRAPATYIWDGPNLSLAGRWRRLASLAGS